MTIDQIDDPGWFENQTDSNYSEVSDTVTPR